MWPNSALVTDACAALPSLLRRGTMRTLGVRVTVRGTLVLGAILAASQVYAGGAVDELLSRNPVKEAEAAFAKGDRRHIVVPTCDGGEVLPGWPLHESPEALDAIEKGRRPVTCADMAPDPKRHVFIRIGRYAEAYNSRLLELSKPRGK